MQCGMRVNDEINNRFVSEINPDVKNTGISQHTRYMSVDDDRTMTDER